jgi:hypothetical protein
MGAEQDRVDQGHDYDPAPYRGEASYGGIPEQGHQYEEAQGQRVPPRPAKYPVSDRKPQVAGLYGQ